MTAPTRRDLAAFAFVAPLLGIVSDAFGQAPSGPAVIETPDGVTTSETGLDRHSHVTAQVTVNGQGPFEFLVDTGANRSAIGEDVAARLGLPLATPVLVNTVIGARMRPTVRVQSLSIQGRVQRDLVLPTLAMNGVAADGVLGVDWLKNHSLTVHFADRRVEIGNPPNFQGFGDRAFVLEARLQAGQLIIVDASTSGRWVNAMIDTGAQYTLGNRALEAVLRARRGGPPPSMKVGVTTVTGERVDGEMMRLADLRLGKSLYFQQPVVFADLRIFELWEMERTPALVLGLDLISRFDSITLDYRRREVTLTFDPSAGGGAKQRARR